MDESTANSTSAASEVAAAAAHAAAAAVAAQAAAAAQVAASNPQGTQGPLVTPSAVDPTQPPPHTHTNGDRDSASVSPPVVSTPNAAVQANMLQNSTKLYEEAAAASAAAAGLTSLGKHLIFQPYSRGATMSFK